MDRIEQYKDKRTTFIARMEDICANAGETSQVDREGQRMIFPGINPRLFDAFFSTFKLAIDRGGGVKSILGNVQIHRPVVGPTTFQQGISLTDYQKVPIIPTILKR